MGLFYGFKLHAMVNHVGEIVRFFITPCNVSDRNQSLVMKLYMGLKITLYGDGGYMSGKFTEKLSDQGIRWMTEFTRTMKNQMMILKDKILLSKMAYYRNNL